MERETAAQVKRVNVNFAIPIYNKLQQLAARKGITTSEALRQAITLTDYLEGAIQDENAKVYIDRGNGLTELVLR